MAFLCCQSVQTVGDTDSAYPRIEQRHGNVVIVTIEDMSPSNNDEAKNQVEALGMILKESALSEQERRLHPRLDHHIIVDVILPQGPLQHTPLREGMILFQINDANIENKSVSQIEHILQTAKPPLRIWAETPSSLLSHHANTNGNQSEKESPLHSTYEKEDQHCDPHVSRCSTASAVSSLSGRMILAVAHKEKVNQTLGLTLKRFSSGTFIVDEIHPTSPFYPRESSLLREGMIVTSINGLSITGMEKEVALSALRDAPGSVVLAAEVHPTMEEPPMIRKRIVATIYKRSPDAPLGLSLIRIPRGKACSPNSPHKKNTFITVVGRISSSCPFRDTDLNVGMEITSVNGLDVSKSDARTILHYLQETCGKIEVLAEIDVPTEDSMTVASSYSGSRSTLSTSSRFHRPNQLHSHSNEMEYSTVTPTEPAGSKASRSSSPLQLERLESQAICPSVNGNSSIDDQVEYNSRSSESAASFSCTNDTGIRTAMAVKLSVDHFLGVAINEGPMGSFIVSQMSPNSPFHSTELQVGAVIMSINGVQLTTGLDMTFVSNLLRSIVGTVVLEFILPKV